MMKTSLLCVALFSLLVGLVIAARCPRTCDLSRCDPPDTRCLAGMTKDHCNCCYICGQKEGQRCYDQDLVRDGLPRSYEQYPPCGEHMNCLLRDDLAPTDGPEAICYCLNEEQVCGSDGKTYNNMCALTEQRYRQRDGLVGVSRGPCRSPPKIVTGPQDVRNKSGTFVAFSCEATGWPVPAIEWRFAELSKRTRKAPRPLPSDDSHIAVQSRGGPNTYEMTSWLQILDIGQADRGIYYCIAANSEGERTAYARLELTDSMQTENDI